MPAVLRRRRVATFAIVAAVSAGGLAQAENQPGPEPAKPSAAPPDSPVFAAYRRLCLDTQADPAAVLAAAGTQGWTQTQGRDTLPLGALSMSDAEQRVVTIGARRLHLAVGHAQDPASLGLKAEPWRVCIVSATPVDPAAATALAALAAVAPAPGSTDASSALYIIADPQGAGRRSAAGLSDAALQALVESHRLLTLGAQTVGPISILLAAEPGR